MNAKTGHSYLRTFNAARYTITVIKSFGCKSTAALFDGKSVKAWANFRTVAERKLQMLHSATRLEDLKVPPNNRLEALKGDRVGQYSIRVNDQWRLCFKFEDGNAFEVEIVDYH